MATRGLRKTCSSISPTCAATAISAKPIREPRATSTWPSAASLPRGTPTVETARGRPRDPHASGAASGNGLLSYGGGVDGIGVTTGHPQVYLIFWGSQWGTSSTGGDGYVHLSGDPAGMAPRLQALFGGVGTNSELWSGVMTQYCEGVSAGATSCASTTAHVAYPTGGALAGVWVDTSGGAPANASEHAIGVELGPLENPSEVELEVLEHRGRVRHRRGHLGGPCPHGPGAADPVTGVGVQVQGPEPALAQPPQQLGQRRHAGCPGKRRFAMAPEDVRRPDRSGPGGRRALLDPANDVAGADEDDDRLQAGIAGQDPFEDQVERLRSDPGAADLRLQRSHSHPTLHARVHTVRT